MASRITNANSFKLASGFLMPKVGYGTWKLPAKLAHGLVFAAIKQGYTLIDCAARYNNEKEIGKALTDAIKRDKIIRRDDIFITSKLWNTDHAPCDVKPAVQRTLRDLQLDYLDLYLMHFPVSWPNRRQNDEDYPEGFQPEFYGLQTDITVYETWKAMEQLVDDGLVKSIGVSNFSQLGIWELDKIADKPISANQIEIHPYLAQSGLVNLCKSKKIKVIGYSSFGPLSYLDYGQYQGLPSKNLMDTDEIKAMSAKYECSPAQILLSWSVNTRDIAVIPKTQNMNRLQENLEVTDIILDDQDVNILDGFDKGLRFNDQTLLWGIPVFN